MNQNPPPLKEEGPFVNQYISAAESGGNTFGHDSADCETINPRYFAWALAQRCPPGPKLILLVISSLVDDEGCCAVSQKRLSDISGVTKRTIPDALKTLQRLGLVDRKAGGSYGRGLGRAPDLIRLREPEQPLKPRVVIPDSGVTLEQRAMVLARDGFKCVACQSEKRLQIDHIRPRSRGGADADDNLQTLCGDCNRSKRDKTMDEWLAWKRGRAA